MTADAKAADTACPIPRGAPVMPGTWTQATPGSYIPIDPTLGEPLEQSFKFIVDNSCPPSDDPHAGDFSAPDKLAPSEQRLDAVHSHGPEARGWIKHFFPSAETVDNLFAYEHMGNYVIERQTGRKLFESMPLYVRVGMHLLFVSGSEYMSYSRIVNLLQSQSDKQGKVYDQTGPTVVPQIQSFIKAYSLPLDELLVKDLEEYPTFNSFFARKLLATARPITSPEDPTVMISPADCRLGVFPTLDAAQTLWIKGKEFTVPNLLLGEDQSDTRFQEILADKDWSIIVARLAPQDYHRFHSPVEGVIVDVKDIAGVLYTVNPQAVNEDLNVFTLNKRSVMLIKANLGPGREAVPIAFVAIGAMLVGSIGWSKKPGDTVAKGEELGWFQYGGSTCAVVVPNSSGLVFDEDLLNTSSKAMETLVKVGMSIGQVPK